MEEVRRKLIALQRSLVEKSRARLEVGANAEESGELRRYRDELHSGTAAYAGLAAREDLLDAAAGSRAVFVGDFHTLRQSQRTPLRLMDQLARRPEFARGERRLVLGLEMVLTDHQRALDRWLAGALDEPGFLRATAYARTWGFAWSSYRPLLEYARRRRIPVLALNSRPEGPARRLARRDLHAARILARLAAEGPETLAVVLFGDLHVADPHLPARYLEEAERLGVAAPCTLVFQNLSHLYWSLAETGLEQIAEVVRLGPGASPRVRGRFCVLNATPLARIRSHVYWEESRETETHERWGFLGEILWSETEVPTDEIAELIESLSGFLELPSPDLNRLTVLPEPGSTAARDPQRPVLRPHPRGIDTTMLARKRPHAATDADVVFLRAASVDHAAEEAAYLVYARVSGAAPTASRPRRDRAWFFILRHALGYFGSKVFNHLRTTYLEEDIERLAADAAPVRWRRRATVRPGGPLPRHVSRAARWILRHLQEVKRSVEGGARAVRPVPARVPGELLPIFARAVGYMLGERLYAAVIQEFVRLEEVGTLFRAPVARPGDAEALVTALYARLHAVRDFYRSREERL